MLQPDDQPQFLLRAMRPTNAYEETMQRLLQSIRLGMIPLGDRLPPERELASMLKVSRDTVREAISTLADQGFVVSRRGRYGGTFVVAELPEHTLGRQHDLSEDEIDDILLLRRVLEIGAVREAAGRDLRAVERASLAETLSGYGDAAGAEARRLDSRLHLKIAELTGSPSLVRQVADVRTRINTALEIVPDLRPNLKNSHDQHRAIVGAILSGQPDAAAHMMAEHLNGTEALLRGYWATTALNAEDYASEQN